MFGRLFGRVSTNRNKTIDNFNSCLAEFMKPYYYLDVVSTCKFKLRLNKFKKVKFYKVCCSQDDKAQHRYYVIEGRDRNYIVRVGGGKNSYIDGDDLAINFISSMTSKGLAYYLKVDHERRCDLIVRPHDVVLLGYTKEKMFVGVNHKVSIRKIEKIIKKIMIKRNHDADIEEMKNSDKDIYEQNFLQQR